MHKLIIIGIGVIFVVAASFLTIMESDNDKEELTYYEDKDTLYFTAEPGELSPEEEAIGLSDKLTLDEERNVYTTTIDNCYGYDSLAISNYDKVKTCLVLIEVEDTNSTKLNATTELFVMAEVVKK